MGKINRDNFISEMIKSYNNDRAKTIALSEESNDVETASKTADNIEDKLTAEPVNNTSDELTDDSNDNSEKEN